MNINLHLAIQDLKSALRSGKIDPHGEDLQMKLLEVFKPHIIYQSEANGELNEFGPQNPHGLKPKFIDSL